MKKLTILFSAIFLTAAIINGQNLLLNGDFESAASGLAGTIGPPGGGVAYSNNRTVRRNLRCSYYVAGGGMKFVAGGGWFFQNVSVTAGLTYQLIVLTGATHWWIPYGKIRLQFKDAGGNNLQNYGSGGSANYC